MGFNTSTVNQYIGAAPQNGEYFDGYMAEFNFIDGQQLSATSFGSTNATTGVWQPKRYSGTYGTNGFYLKFSDIGTTSGSNSGLGKDFSGKEFKKFHKHLDHKNLEDDSLSLDKFSW